MSETPITDAVVHEALAIKKYFGKGLEKRPTGLLLFVCWPNMLASRNLNLATHQGEEGRMINARVSLRFVLEEKIFGSNNWVCFPYNAKFKSLTDAKKAAKTINGPNRIIQIVTRRSLIYENNPLAKVRMKDEI
jgi:hypothetical protein